MCCYSISSVLLCFPGAKRGQGYRSGLGRRRFELAQRDRGIKLREIVIEESPNGGNQARRCLGIDSIRRGQSEGIVELPEEIPPVLRDDDPALCAKTLRGSNLMVVTGFA